jgi:hypothetical protein
MPNSIAAGRDILGQKKLELVFCKGDDLVA